MRAPMALVELEANVAKHTKIYPSSVLPSLIFAHIPCTPRLPVFAHISRHLYTAVHHLATLARFFLPPPLHVFPRMVVPPPLKSPLLAKPSKHGASTAARIARLPSRALSTKHLWSRHHPSTVSSCPRCRPSSPIPLATHSARRSQTHPFFPFPSPLRTSRTHSFPPFPMSHAASESQSHSCSAAPSIPPPPLQQKQMPAWWVSQRLRISQSS